jgi:hypothetical protein
MRDERVRSRTATVVLATACLALAAQLPAVAQAQDAPECVVSGTVTAGTLALPGVAVTFISADPKVARATSTNGDGTYFVKLPASGRYEVTLELTGFAPIVRTVDLAPGLPKPAFRGVARWSFEHPETAQRRQDHVLPQLQRQSIEQSVRRVFHRAD